MKGSECLIKVKHAGDSGGGGREIISQVNVRLRTFEEHIQANRNTVLPTGERL